MITIDFECALFLTHERTLHCHAVVPLHSGRVVASLDRKRLGAGAFGWKQDS